MTIKAQEIQYGGLILEVSENDFILGSDNISVDLANRENPDEIIYEYNQGEDNVTRNACSIFASSAAVNDLANRPESTTIIKSRWLRSLKLWAIESKGWYFYKAVDQVRKEYNLENPTNRVASFRLQNGETLKAALRAGYSIVAGFKGNSDYNVDKSDWRIDGTKFPNWNYAHCVRIRERNGKIVVVDNYVGTDTYNIYELADFDKLVANDVYFNEFYLFIREKALTQSQLKRLWAKGKGIWNGQYENSFSTRGEIAEMSINTAIKFIEWYPFNSTMTKRKNAQSNGIWNGENENGNCTRYEASLMIGRAIGDKVVWSQENPNQFITRGEVAEMIANTFA